MKSLMVGWISILENWALQNLRSQPQKNCIYYVSPPQSHLLTWQLLLCADIIDPEVSIVLAASPQLPSVILIKFSRLYLATPHYLEKSSEWTMNLTNGPSDGCLNSRNLEVKTSLIATCFCTIPLRRIHPDQSETTVSKGPLNMCTYESAFNFDVQRSKTPYLLD